jgi:hypothetical protein
MGVLRAGRQSAALVCWRNLAIGLLDDNDVSAAFSSVMGDEQGRTDVSLAILLAEFPVNRIEGRGGRMTRRHGIDRPPLWITRIQRVRRSSAVMFIAGAVWRSGAKHFRR